MKQRHRGRAFGLVMGLLLFAWVGGCILAMLRMAGPGTEAVQALQRLDAAAPQGQHNAFARVWVLGRDVPDSQLSELMAAEAVRSQSQAPSASRALDDYAELPVPPAAQRCVNADSACLHKVRSQIGDPADWLKRHQALWAQLQALQRADHYRQTLPVQAQTKMPSLILLGLYPTFRAVQFAGGYTAQALEGSCRDLQLWRRLTGNSDSVLLSLVAARAVGSSIQLIAEMLSDSPQAQLPWPQNCQLATAPLQAHEAHLCAAMHGEMQFAREAMRLEGSAQAAQDESSLMRLLRPLRFDDARTLGALAQARIRFCDPALAARVSQDKALDLPPWQPPGPWSRTCYGNWGGCQLLGISDSAMAQYPLDLQDASAQLKLLRTWRWLRTQPHPADAPALTATLARVPADVGVPDRALHLVNAGQALAMPLKRAKAEPAHWALPWPQAPHAALR